MRMTALLSAMLLAAAVASAQTTPAQTNAPQAPSSSTPAAGSAQTSPPASPHRMLQAKSEDELKAYQAASAETDPAKAEAAANDFAAKFPNSELRAALYMRVMNLYAQSNNTNKVIETGRQAIAADPTNPVPLMEVASSLAETTRDTDLDREQRLAEAAKDAHAAIDNIDTGLLVPANADPARVAAAKHTILTNSYDTLGLVDMSRNDYKSAASNLQKAIDISQDNPEAVLYLRLSVVQDKLQQYQEALDSANKAVQYAKDGTPAQNLAKQQQERLKKLIEAQSAPGAGTAPGGAAPKTTPQTAPIPGAQTSPSPVPGSPSTPH